jgi:RimJ/RimL family protein N-acetyltransferase
VTPALETPRLLLRPLTLADAEQAQALFGTWEVVRHLAAAVPWPYPADGALTHYRDVLLPAAARGEAWAWSLRLRTAPEQLVGTVTLWRREEEHRGFWLGLPWQRQGLMTEACEAVTAYWFDVLGFPVLRASKASANTASRRISLRQGMRLVRTEEHDTVSGRQPAETFEITAAEWRGRRRSPAP